MVGLPRFKRLRAFVEEFKRDFDCLQVQPQTTRPHQFSIYVDALNDNHGQLQVEGSSTNAESSLTLTTTASSSNPAIVDSPQPMIEVHAQKSPDSVIAASPISSTSSATLVSQAIDDTVDSCTSTAEEATLALAVPAPYPTPPPETEDGTGLDTSGTEEDSKSQETVGDDDRPQHMTYQFHNCQNVFMNAFNAQGVKVENAGNNAPQFTYNSSPTSSNSSSSLYHGDFCQLSRYDVPSDIARYELPPMLPPLSFQESMDSLLHPPGIPPVEIPGPDSDQFTVVPPARQASVSPRNSSLMQVDYDDDANWSLHSQKMPGSKNFKLPKPDSKFPSLTIDTSGHLNHMGFYLPPFPGAAVQNVLANNSTSSPDPDSILEDHLELVLEAVQKKLRSGTFSPRAQDSLKLINALVSTESPASSARTTSTGESLYSCDSAHSRPYNGYC